MLLNIDIRGGKMTDKEKYEIIKKEIDELYIKQFEDERKQNFISELEAIKYTRKQDKEIKEFVEKRKKELGISTNWSVFRLLSTKCGTLQNRNLQK